MGIRGRIRRDSKHRVLRAGESMRADGKYQFKYHIAGKPHFVYSWKLEPTDKLPAGKKPCLSLRELEKQIGYDLGITVRSDEKKYNSERTCRTIPIHKNRGETQYSCKL